MAPMQASGLVPVNMSAEDAHAMAGLKGDLPDAPAVTDLASWDQETYSLDVSAATSLGFPLGNLSATFKRQALMFGMSRWKDVSKNDQTYRFGVALRAIVVISELKSSGELTLPVLAAKVELGDALATAQLLVRGYKGAKLGDYLPSWQTFGVDSYGKYMQAVSDIQKLITEDEANIQPELLATTVISPLPPQTPPAAAVGSVYALHALSGGSSFAHAVEKLPTDDGDVLVAVRMVYRAWLGEDERAGPTEEQQHNALQQLFSLHLKEGWFG